MSVIQANTTFDFEDTDYLLTRDGSNWIITSEQPKFKQTIAFPARADLTLEDDYVKMGDEVVLEAILAGPYPEGHVIGTTTFKAYKLEVLTQIRLRDAQITYRVL